MAPLKRPADDEYYEESWTQTLFQGDVFRDVPLAFPWPADVVLVGERESERRFLSGPFEITHAMLITPTCTMSAQGRLAPAGGYSMAARALVPVRPLTQVLEEEAVTEQNLGHLRADRLRNFFYLPANPGWDLPESVALLYQPTTVHHDVIRDLRAGQLSGAGHRQLLRSLAFYSTGARITFEELGPPAGPKGRVS